MADVYRHRLEYEKARRFAVGTTQAIEMGDMVYWDGTTLKPASSISYTSLAQAQEDFVKSYVGQARQKSPTGDGHLSPILVDTGGIKEMICASATWTYGDLVGMDDNATPDALEDQTVIAVTDPRLAIGKCARTEASAVTSVLVELFPPPSLAPGQSISDEYSVEHTVTAGEDTAGSFTVDTGFGAAPSHIQILHIKNTSLEITAGAKVSLLTGGDAGKIKVEDGGATTVAQDDVVYIRAWR